MANSLEARVPYLDHELVEFAFRIPDRLKVRWLQGKRVLRGALRGLLPVQALRRRKSGFSVPIASWLRGEFRDLANDLLSPSRIGQHGIFCGQAIRNVLRDHVTGSADHSRTLWGLIMFQLWSDRFRSAQVIGRQTSPSEVTVP